MDRKKYEKHTLGPLSVRRHYDTELWCVADEKDYLVMVTPFFGECSPDMTDGERYANAQLMADAPDLLAENEKMQNALETLRNDFQMIIDGDDMSGMSDNELFTAMMETITNTGIF